MSNTDKVVLILQRKSLKVKEDAEKDFEAELKKIEDKRNYKLQLAENLSGLASILCPHTKEVRSKVERIATGEQRTLETIVEVHCSTCGKYLRNE